MARGRPRAWGLVLGVPTVILGGYLVASGSPQTIPSAVGYPFLVLGLISTGGGYFISRMAPEQMSGDPVAVFTPNQLGAYLFAGMSVVPLVVTLYLLFFTRVPYVWPTITSAIFALTFIKALVGYWRNSLTRYYVLEGGQVVSEYRFVSLNRSTVDAASIQGVDRSQSAVETLIGLGNVTVRSASGDLSFRNLTTPAEAEEVLMDVREQYG